MLHRHHIVPRHAGGTDDPANLVTLTVPEHAEAHRVLWETHGRIEDKLAWHMLAGLDEKEDTWRELLSERKRGNTNRKGKRVPFKARPKAQGRTGTFAGRTHTEETKAKMRARKAERRIVLDAKLESYRQELKAVWR